MSTETTNDTATPGKTLKERVMSTTTPPTAGSPSPTITYAPFSPAIEAAFHALFEALLSDTEDSSDSSSLMETLPPMTQCNMIILALRAVEFELTCRARRAGRAVDDVPF